MASTLHFIGLDYQRLASRLFDVSCPLAGKRKAHATSISEYLMLLS
ncbi:MAG TPA: hypothetical protein VJM50_14715 [Pyrinomonadaceae bacterium]|nr:hypothetical protein [Pyrinomonadaceae bacterium]